MPADHEPRIGTTIDAIASRLEKRFRVRGAVPWGHSIPYVEVDSEVGPLVIAAPPLDCAADPELERWFLTLAFGLAGIPGRAFPRIVRYGVADGLPFLAYRPPSGRPLAQRLKQGPLSSRSVLRVLERVLDALATAHRHGLVHGELRPENILIDESGERLAVTVLGVGLLPVLEEARNREGQRRSGAAPALSSYRAPELLGGERPTAASDLYALGALIHHMVSGRPPGGFETSEAYEDLPALLDVVRRAMAAEPDDRYASADAMRAALDWVEVESEKMQAHTQDIPLWMEHSMVGNIPVPELLRSRSSAPPHSDRAPRSNVEPIERVPPAPRVPHFSEPPPPRDILSVYPPLAPVSESTEPSLRFDLGLDMSEAARSASLYPPNAYLPMSKPITSEKARPTIPTWVEPALVCVVLAMAGVLGYWLAK